MLYRFLWARLSIEEICTQDNDKGIIEALERLPQGLSALLNRKLDRVFAGSGAPQAIKTLQFCGVAKRPLTVDELRELLSIEPSQLSLDRTRFPNDMDRIFRDCGGLTFVDEEENTVHYVHHSIQLHLFKSRDSLLGEFVEADLNIRLGNLCMTYANLNDFKRQLVKVGKKSAPPIPLSPLQIGIGAVAGNQMAQKLLRQRSKGRNLVSEDFHRQAQTSLGPINASRSESILNMQNFSFLAYAKEYWIHHLNELNGDKDDRTWKLFCKCIDSKTIAIDRPWTTFRPSRNFVDILKHRIRPEMFMELPEEIQWCVMNKHHSFFLYLALFHFDVSPDRVKDVILLYSLYHGSYQFGQIIAKHASSGSRSRLAFLEKALSISAALGFVRAVRAFLDMGAAIDARVDFLQVLDMTPLQAAAIGGHLVVVEMLVKRGADVNGYRDLPIRYSPLCAAAEKGYLEIVKILLAAGANVDGCPNKTLSYQPLQAAAKGGHIEIVEILLQAGASVQGLDNEIDRSNPLTAAREKGHSEIVKKLLNAGADTNASLDSG